MFLMSSLLMSHHFLAAVCTATASLGAFLHQEVFRRHALAIFGARHTSRSAKTAHFMMEVGIKHHQLRGGRADGRTAR